MFTPTEAFPMPPAGVGDTGDRAEGNKCTAPSAAADEWCGLKGSRRYPTDGHDNDVPHLHGVLQQQERTVMMSCTSFCDPKPMAMPRRSAGAREEERDVDANLAQA